MPAVEKKFVVVGDGESGKTCLLHVFFEDVYPDVYVPTAFDCFTTVVEVDGKKVKLSLWDTAGQEDYDRLRPLSYPNADAVIVCYSIDTPESLANVVEKWSPEVRYFCRDVPVILVGNKKDLRDLRDGDGIRESETGPPVTVEHATDGKQTEPMLVREQGQTVADEIGAFAFLECSAKTKEGVRDVFVAAVKATRAENKQCALL